jgi:ubiquinone/menaquinone biosynthesis C-methylase UbiE
MPADESAENRVYNELIASQLSTNKEDFCPFRRERQMDHLFRHLAREFAAGPCKVLDICGGYGRLTYFMNELDPRQEYHCLDFSEQLIRQARQSFAGSPNIHCGVADLYALSPKYDKAFDITVLYKTLYCLPYYKQAMEQLVRVTRRRIYITSPFFEGDIDFISRIYPDASKGDEGRYAYSNAYSIPKFERYCRSLGAKNVEFEDMRLDLDLPPPENRSKLQTHTVRTADQGRLEITGVLILHWKLAILTL